MPLTPKTLAATKKINMNLDQKLEPWVRKVDLDKEAYQGLLHKLRVNNHNLCLYRPSPQHYYPTLLDIKAELEDGMTVPMKQGSDVLSPDVSFSDDGSPARFGFDDSVFPGYSWRGYAAMSDLQV